MGLMRCLHFIAARFNLLLSATHIAGIANSLADALSRDNLLLFFKHHPQANCSPSPIPPALLDLLVHSRPSPSWSNKFNTIFSQLSPRIQCVLTPPATEGTQAFAQPQEPGPSPRQSQYCASLSYAQQHLKHQTIKCYLSGIRFYQIIQSHPDPFITNMPKLQYVLRGIKSEEVKKDQPQRQCLPVTPTILHKIHQVLLCNPNDFNNIMLWSAFLLCFFRFLRSGEITIPDASSYDPSVHLNF